MFAYWAPSKFLRCLFYTLAVSVCLVRARPNLLWSIIIDVNILATHSQVSTNLVLTREQKWWKSGYIGILTHHVRAWEFAWIRILAPALVGEEPVLPSYIANSLQGTGGSHRFTSSQAGPIVVCKVTLKSAGSDSTAASSASAQIPNMWCFAGLQCRLYNVSQVWQNLMDKAYVDWLNGEYSTLKIYWDHQ